MRERCTSARSFWPFPDPSSSSCATSSPSSTSKLTDQWIHPKESLSSSHSGLNSLSLFPLSVYSPTSSPPFSSLSQYSDENMMDPYNLAICYGPTLMPTPDSLDQVSCQAHVNEIVKTIIIHHETIFPDAKELEGPIYEKCMAGGDYWWGTGPVDCFLLPEIWRHSSGRDSVGCLRGSNVSIAHQLLLFDNAHTV